MPTIPWLVTQAWLTAATGLGDLRQKVQIIEGDSTQPADLLETLQRHYREGIRDICIVDVGELSGDMNWRFVADGVNKTGSNPLRGLSGKMPQPFIDVSSMYHVPAGYEGVVVTAIGDYNPQGAWRNSWRHGHALALLAHAASLRVTGVLFRKNEPIPPPVIEGIGVLLSQA